MEEIWKDIAGYEGLYQISNLGKVKSLKRNPIIILKPWISTHGYYKIALSKNSKHTKLYLHSLLLEYFVSPRPEGMVCRHLDGNRLNNSLDNLKWGTPKENTNDMMLHGNGPVGENYGNAKLTNEKVIYIRNLYNNGKRIIDIAKELNLNENHICSVVHNKIWKHLLTDIDIQYQNKRDYNLNKRKELIKEAKHLIIQNVSPKEISIKLGLSYDTVLRVKLNKVWKHIKL